MKKCEKCKHFRCVGGANVLDYLCTKKNKYIDFGTLKAMFCKYYETSE